MRFILTNSLLFTVISTFCFANFSYSDDHPNTNPADSASQTIIKSHAIAMHGTPKYGKDFSGFEYTSAEAKKGGEMKLATIGTYDTFNGFLAKGNVAVGTGMLYDTLLQQADDEAFSMYPLLAQSVEYPADRSWITFHLNPKARFHDGHPVTADDVVFTFNTLIEKGSPQYAQYYHDVKNVKALNDLAVKFTFVSSTNKELPLILGQLAILPEHYWQEHDFTKADLTTPLGSGPYKIAKYNAGRSITYQRVDDYWAKDLPVNRGLYNVDQLHYDYYRDHTVALEAFKAGAYDVRNENTAKFWATAYTGKAVDQGHIKKVEIYDASPTGMQALFLNTRRAPFDNIEFRKAVNYAFDFEYINKTIFYNAYSRANSFFNNSELASSGLPEGRELNILKQYQEQLPDSVFTTEYQPPVSDGKGHNRKNLVKAQRLLKAAGYTFKQGKVFAPNSDKPISFEIITFSPTYKRVYNPYIENLKKLGIQVSLRIVDTSQWLNRVRQYDYDATTYPLGQSLSPGNEQRYFWSSKAANTEGMQNFSGVSSPVVDELIEKLINAHSREDLIVYTRALDRVLLHQHLVIPQWYLQQHRIAYWDKFSRPDTPPPYDPTYSTGLMSWWVDPTKADALNKVRN